MQPEVKYISAEIFTRSIENSDNLINRNIFFPRILIVTAGSIGDGLDTMDVHSVVRGGYPTSILEILQEIGRCRRGITNSDDNVTDHFHLLLTCYDFDYLNQCLYLPPDEESNNNNPTIDRAEEISIQRSNLLILLQMIVLKGQFWHIQLKDMLENPCDPSHLHVACGNACPSCRGDTEEFIMLIRSAGISSFLADIFINNSTGSLTPKVLIKKLSEYTNVDKLVYGQLRSNNC